MEERRRFKRMDVSLNGRFMVEDTKEYPCEVFNMSPGGHGGESTFTLRASANGSSPISII